MVRWKSQTCPGYEEHKQWNRTVSISNDSNDNGGKVIEWV